MFVKINGVDKEAIVTDEEDIEDVDITYEVDGSATSITIVNENGETSTLE